MAEYQSLVDRATNVANQPYQPYQGEQVAPLTSQTLGGLGGINQYANTAQPYLGAAGAMTMGASAPVNPSQFQGMGSLQGYLNPFTSSVVDTTQAEMNNQNQQQAQFLNSANISSGAFGGDRAGIGQSILANQQQLAEAPTVAGLNQANYAQAMQNWQQQQGVNLGAQQANRTAQLQGAAQLGQIGETAQQAGLQGSQAQIQAGMIPQQEQQAIDTAAQNMYQTSQAYPFTTTGWLGNIIEGTGGLSGGQSQTTSPGPNSIAQGLGAATQGIGMLGSLMSLSDERAKENVEAIGKTYDGQNIYRYNFKGDPRTQIGLIAQEEAYHDPGSVQRVGMGDLLGIDYGRATEHAAERGHFADGGEATGAAAEEGGGMPQQPQQQRQPGASPDYDLVMSGLPGARMGLGSMALLGGTNMRPQPMLPLAQPPQRQSFDDGGTVIGGVTIPAGGPQPLGPNGQFGYGTPGFIPGVTQLSPTAGVPEALFGEESAGSKDPYTGIDTDQIQAIGGGQWLPPVTNSPEPDWGNLQNSPQFGSAEASLAGQFGPNYTPGQTPNKPTAPAANAGLLAPSSPQSSSPQMFTQYTDTGQRGQQAVPNEVPMGGRMIPGGAGATAGGLSRAQLGQIASQFLGGGGSGGTNVSGINPPGRASGGRASFAGGGFPQFTTFQPSANQGRNPPTYTALDLSHIFGGGTPPPAIAMQRHLQGQARAKAAVQRGIVKPRVIAPDPTTGVHHDITPPLPPPRPQDYRPEDDPRPQPPDPSGAAMPPKITRPNLFAPTFGGGYDSSSPSRGAGMGYPSRGIVPPAAPGTPAEAPFGGRAAFYPGLERLTAGPAPKAGLPATVTPPLTGETEWRPPSTNVEEPRIGDYSEVMRGGARPALPAPISPPQFEGRGGTFGPRAIDVPRGDDSPMWPDQEVDLPGVFHGGGRGVVAQARGGRIGRADGGQLDTSYGPQQPVSDMSDAQFGRALQDEMRGQPSSDMSWIDQLTQGLPSNADWNAMSPGGGGGQAVQGGGGGGGGGGYRGDVTSLMGGLPITAGHFVPTTGNARGATYVPGGGGISPNARAQAPEHPAITVMRHIVRAHDAAPVHTLSKVDPNMGPFMPPRGSEIGGEGTSVVPGYQGGGGVMGSSPVMNAGGYTPQGQGMTGTTSQGGGLGSVATAAGASGGFGDLFGGGGRAGFAEGGGAAVDPFLAAITSSVPQAGGGGSHGPPNPPQAPQPPSQGGGGPGGGDSLGKLGDAVKKFAGQIGGQQASPSQPYLSPADQANLPDFSQADTSAMDAASSGSVFDGLQDSDLGFATGGGVGLGSLRGNFQDGGDAGSPPSGFDEAITGAVAPPAPAPGGGGGGVADLINQNFGNRAGYASTIANRESSMGKAYVGDGGSSFGPFQLHYGGINKDMPHPGLGDEFTKETGLDARDPKTVPQQIAFVSKYTAQHGWNDWSTAKQDNPGPARGGADAPSPDAQPAQASTESYGGGFVLPGPDQSQQPPSQAPTIGSELRRDPFGYLMTVGAGMMASRAPQLGTAIGEGFEAGNKYLQASQQLETAWNKNQAEINNLSAEAREHGADTALKVQQLQVGAMMNKVYFDMLRQKGLIGGSPAPAGGSGTGGGGLAPLPPLGGGTGAGGAPTGGAGPSGGGSAAAAPAGGAAPTVTAGGAPAPSGGGAAAAPAGGGIPSLNKDPDYIAGTKLIEQGKQQNLIHPGLGDDLIAQGTAQQEAAKENWEKAAGPIEKGQEEAASGQATQRNEENEEVADRVGGLQTEVQSLEALRELLKRVPTGWATTNFADAQNTLATFGIHVGNPAEIREFVKYTTSDIWNNLKEQKGAVRNKEMDAASKMNVDPDAPAAANAEILAKQLGLARLQIGYAKDYRDWDKANPGTVSPTGFKTDWMLKNDLGKYVANERKNIAYVGQPVPAKGKLEPGQLYRLPNGKFARAKDANTMTYEE